MGKTTVRLIADDLTGALDTAAEFVPLTGPVQVFWQGADMAALPTNAALDLGTRESSASAARDAMTQAVPALLSADIAFKKIDSLIRGQTLSELAACFLAGHWARCVLAPAFPFQGRITRGARQFMADDAGWLPVGPNLVEALRRFGVPTGPGELGAPMPPGISVFDAEADAELDTIVAQAGGASAPVLWCGTGGLARALAGRPPGPAPALPRPHLGLFGSDQAATAAQLAACAPHWLVLSDDGAHDARPLADAMARHGLVLVSHALPPGMARGAAARRIDAVFGRLPRQLPKPGTLVAAGGETLRGLCLGLGARSLEVLGRAVPGVPISRLCGGAWDGVTVLSKSGAFGPPALLRELLSIPDPKRTIL